MMIALCAHLLYTNSELLIAAKEFATAPATMFDKICLTGFALSYSLISALCVFHLQKYLPVMIFALLDGFAVYLRINVNQEPFLLLTALFFGFYTFSLISFCFLISKQNRKQNENGKSEPKNENILSENENILSESEVEAIVKQLSKTLNPMKNETKRIELIEKQKPQVRERLLLVLKEKSESKNEIQQQLEF